MKEKRYLFHFMRHLKEYAEKIGNANLKEIGLTMPQGHIILFLSRAENHSESLKHVEASLQVAQSTVAIMISKLENKGFVKTYMAQDDKRVKCVALTEKGLLAVEKFESIMDTVNGELFKSLTEAECAMLLELLEKMENGIIDKK